jgi:hypothetical protein
MVSEIKIGFIWFKVGSSGGLFRKHTIEPSGEFVNKLKDYRLLNDDPFPRS